jgi:hypothetical protein
VASGTDSADITRFEFFKLGSQYYVAGRYAVAGGLNPVAANLLHHAIELFLKGALYHHATEEERRNKLGHKLVVIWTCFKTQIGAGRDLTKFDGVIDELNKYEEIRYPENIVLKGMGSALSFGKTMPAVISGEAADVVPKYQLFVGEIDALVKAILDISSVNPKVLVPMQPDGQTYLKHQNEEKGLF